MYAYGLWTDSYSIRLCTVDSYIEKPTLKPNYSKVLEKVNEI